MLEAIRAALAAAHHELTTLHGLTVQDGAAPDTWRIDTRRTLHQVEQGLRDLETLAGSPLVVAALDETDLALVHARRATVRLWGRPVRDRMIRTPGETL